MSRTPCLHVHQVNAARSNTVTVKLKAELLSHTRQLVDGYLTYKYGGEENICAAIQIMLEEIRWKKEKQFLIIWDR